MQTIQWKVERAGVGSYHVRCKAIGDEGQGTLIPGLIIGAPGTWFIQRGGVQSHTKYRTRNSAAGELARRQFLDGGIGRFTR